MLWEGGCAICKGTHRGRLLLFMFWGANGFTLIIVKVFNLHSTCWCWSFSDFVYLLPLVLSIHFFFLFAFDLHL